MRSTLGILFPPSKIIFIDVYGQIIQENNDSIRASYAPNGNEGFVRVKVEQTDSDNKQVINHLFSSNRREAPNET